MLYVLKLSIVHSTLTKLLELYYHDQRCYRAHRILTRRAKIKE